jgi:HNH endonuclease
VCKHAPTTQVEWDRWMKGNPRALAVDELWSCDNCLAKREVSTRNIAVVAAIRPFRGGGPEKATKHEAKARAKSEAVKVERAAKREAKARAKAEAKAVRTVFDLLGDVLTAVAGAERSGRYSGRPGYRRNPDGSVVTCCDRDCGEPMRGGTAPQGEAMHQECRRKRWITCRICGDPMHRGDPSLWKGLPQGQAECYKHRDYHCRFPGCGVEIAKDVRERGTDLLLCPEHAERSYIARAIRYGAPWEIFDDSIDVLFERCGGICGICEMPVDVSLRYPNELSSSLDHIVPLSTGPGSPGHVDSNCQLAHLCCNKLKNNKLSIDVATARALVLSIDPSDSPKSKPRKICPECKKPVMKSARTFHPKCWELQLQRWKAEREAQCERQEPRPRQYSPNPELVERGKKAAVMRANGAAWQDIADELYNGSSGNAYVAASKYGNPVVIAKWPSRVSSASSRKGSVRLDGPEINRDEPITTAAQYYAMLDRLVASIPDPKRKRSSRIEPSGKSKLDHLGETVRKEMLRRQAIYEATQQESA